MSNTHNTRDGHNFCCPFIRPLSVDPLINRTMLIFYFENVNLTEERLFLNLFMVLASCCRTAVGVSQRALSLSAHMAGGPPPTPGPGEGDVTTPSYRSIAGTTVTSLLRGTGGF
jgi:hypothetical protein